MLPLFTVLSLTCSGLGDVLLGGGCFSPSRLGFGEMFGFGARTGLYEMDGSVSCFFRDLLSEEEVGGAMLPVELVFGRVVTVLSEREGGSEGERGERERERER